MSEILLVCSVAVVAFVLSIALKIPIHQYP